MKVKRPSSGFTIIELLIVIVVIAVIASISLLAYSGVQNKARAAVLQSDLKQAASQLTMHLVVNGRYPDSLGELGVKYEDSQVDFQYTVDNDSVPPIYCVTGMYGNMTYFVFPGAPPQEGVCEGHDAPGNEDPEEPQEPDPEPLIFSDISAGGSHTCAIAGGQAYCWGAGASGRLGNGSTDNALVPSAVYNIGLLSGKTVSKISAEANAHTCAIAGGLAYCWGSNGSGRLGDNGSESSSVPVAVYTAGGLSGKTVTDISAGYNHSCVVAGGLGYCWASNTNGRLGNNSTTASSVPVAVYTSGVLSGKTMTSIAAATGGASHHTCAVASSLAYCWGSNGSNGAAGTGFNGDSYYTTPRAVSTSGVLSGKTVTSIKAGGSYSCAIADGKAYCWGLGSSGQLGRNSTNTSTVPVAVNTDVMTGDIAAISAGPMHACAIADGKAYCWGDNSSGQLGDNSTTQRNSPVAVSAGVMSGTVTAISAGTSHTCAIADGKAYCWGAGGSGRLGHGSTDDSLVPVELSPLY